MPTVVERELIDSFIKTNPLMNEYKELILEAITAHPTPIIPLVRSLQILQKAGLFSGISARTNFMKAMKLTRPQEIAEAISLFISAPFPYTAQTQEGVQAYFEHIIRHDNTWLTTPIYDLAGSPLIDDKRNYWINLANAFKHLFYRTNLFRSPLASLNFDSLIKIEIPYITKIISCLLNKTSLLNEPATQSNFNLLMKHKDLESLDKALVLFISCTPFDEDRATLFNGMSAQANFELLVSKDELDVAFPELQIIFGPILELAHAQEQFTTQMMNVAIPTGRTLDGGIFSLKKKRPAQSLLLNLDTALRPLF